MTSQPACLVGVMPSPEALAAVLMELKSKGFEVEQFGVLAAAEEHDERFAELSANPESEKTLEAAIIGGLFYVGAVTAAGATVLSGGGLGAILLAIMAGGGTSGLVGLLAAAGFHSQHAEVVGKRLDEGRIVVWIVPHGVAQWALANDTLKKSAALEVMVNGTPPA